MSSGRVFQPRSKVVPAADLDAVVDATAYAAEARRLHASAKREAAELFEEARLRGYEAGHAEGRREGFATLAAAVAEARAHLAGAEDGLGGLVLDAVARILGEARADEEDFARRLIGRALAELTEGVGVTVKAPPADWAVVGAAVAALARDGAAPGVRGVEVDPLLKPGELVLETPQGRVHVGARQQLAHLASAIGEAA